MTAAGERHHHRLALTGTTQWRSTPRSTAPNRQKHRRSSGRILRAINHLTGHGPIPAPTAYRILGDLKGVGHLLPQALTQLCRGLQASLAAFDVYDRRRDPGESVSDAVALLARAARKAAALGQLLEDAQTAISDQGYRTDDDHPSLFDDEGDSR